MSFWVTLVKPMKLRGRERSAFCVDAPKRDDVQLIVADLLQLSERDIANIQSLPYPAEPRLNYKDGACPSFCIQPDKCAGKTSCPRSIACSE